MMKDKENNEKFEAFKADILKWKHEHREEYNEFARIMTNCDETFYYQIFKAVSGQMRHVAREWELSWGDDGDETFDSIFILVSTYSGVYPFSIPGLQSAVRSAKIGSF